MGIISKNGHNIRKCIWYGKRDIMWRNGHIIEKSRFIRELIKFIESTYIRTYKVSLWNSLARTRTILKEDETNDSICVHKIYSVLWIWTKTMVQDTDFGSGVGDPTWRFGPPRLPDHGMSQLRDPIATSARSRSFPWDRSFRPQTLR